MDNNGLGGLCCILRCDLTVPIAFSDCVPSSLDILMSRAANDDVAVIVIERCNWLIFEFYLFLYLCLSRVNEEHMYTKT